MSPSQARFWLGELTSLARARESDRPERRPDCRRLDARKADAIENAGANDDVVRGRDHRPF
eukprot:4480395-Pyramimonas_sp.AAC.1